MIIDHLSRPSSDLARRRAYFDLASAPLGIGVVKEYPAWCAWAATSRAT